MMPQRVVSAALSQKIPASTPHFSPLCHKPGGLALDGLKDLKRSEMKATRVNAYTRSAFVEWGLKMKKKGNNMRPTESDRYSSHMVSVSDGCLQGIDSCLELLIDQTRQSPGGG